jgi:ribonucleoside-diphosphate reductase beta chain
MSVFNFNNTKPHTERTMFFDESVDVARYDKVKYPNIDKLTDKQLGYFWRPEEVALPRDGKDFRDMSSSYQFIFSENIKRQILLDSAQGRAPSLAFLPICSLPELEVWIQTWSFFETIHSKSYTHIIKNVYNDPSKVLDTIKSSPEIVDCAKDISRYYDDLIRFNDQRGNFTGGVADFNLYEHKKALWLAMHSVNALEGIRFYASFACSWNFAELKLMEGNAKIIGFIARDENLHLAVTQQILKLLPKEDPDFAAIREECKPQVMQIWLDVINQEKTWAKYIMQHGSMIGLNEKLLCDYLDWIAYRRMSVIGLTPFTKSGTNPLPWTTKWIGGADVQPAPQEVEIQSYVIGGVTNDVTDTTFSNFEL